MPYGLVAGYDVRERDIGAALCKTWDVISEDGPLTGSLDLILHIKAGQTATAKGKAMRSATSPNGGSSK